MSSLYEKQEESSNENAEEEATASTNEDLPKKSEEEGQSIEEGLDKTPEKDLSEEENEDSIQETPSKASETYESNLKLTDEENQEDEESVSSESGLLFIEDFVYDAVPSVTTMFMVDSKNQDLIQFYDIAFPDNSFIDIAESPPPPPMKDYSVEKRHSDISVVLKPYYGLSDADEYDTDIKEYLTTCKKLDAPVVLKVVEGLHNDSIDLKYYGVHNESVPAIAEALTNNPHVKKLSLEDTWLNYDAAVHLGKMLEQNKLLTHLNLKNCRIGPKGIEALKIGITRTQNLKMLDLTGNNIGDGLEPLAEALSENWSITTLILRDNNLSTGAVPYLVHFLEENWSIMDLDLSLNSFYPREAMKPLMKALGKNKSVTRLNLSWNGLCMPVNAHPIRSYLFKSTTVESLDLSYNRLEGTALKMIKTGCLRSQTLQTLILDNNPLTPDDAVGFLQAFTKPTAPLAELSMKDIWVHKDFLEALEEVRNVRPIQVSIGGVYSNYIIEGPDEKKLLFARANFECMMPKSRRKQRNFGYFVLKLGDKLMRKSKFRQLVADAKLIVAPNLINQIMKQFQGKRRRVDQNALKEYYLNLYPDTKLPEVKKKKQKRKGRKGRKGKKGKKGKSSDTTNTTTSEPTASETATSNAETETSASETEDETATTEAVTSETETATSEPEAA